MRHFLGDTSSVNVKLLTAVGSATTNNEFGISADCLRAAGEKTTSDEVLDGMSCNRTASRFTYSPTKSDSQMICGTPGQADDNIEELIILLGKLTLDDNVKVYGNQRKQDVAQRQFTKSSHFTSVMLSKLINAPLSTKLRLCCRIPRPVETSRSSVAVAPTKSQNVTDRIRVSQMGVGQLQHTSRRMRIHSSSEKLSYYARNQNCSVSDSSQIARDGLQKSRLHLPQARTVFDSKKTSADKTEFDKTITTRRLTPCPLLTRLVRSACR
ncbi:MAG: hypothetical protein MUD01_25375, partial [Chloroflexaceae bacterium]|nr:hypothetical protein [Chloroflexaceae bacterium]